MVSVCLEVGIGWDCQLNKAALHFRLLELIYNKAPGKIFSSLKE